MPRQRKRGSANRIESYVEWAARIDSEVEAAARAMKPIDSPMLRPEPKEPSRLIS